eukprot:1749598-Pyramimonas_sp.AAC.1
MASARSSSDCGLNSATMRYRMQRSSASKGDSQNGRGCEGRRGRPMGPDSGPNEADHAIPKRCPTPTDDPLIAWSAT